MRMKIDEFTTNYFVCNFTEQEYLDMLTGFLPSATEKKIIDAFINYLKDRKKDFSINSQRYDNEIQSGSL